MIPSIFATEWAPGNLQSDKYQMSLEGIFKKVRDLGASYTHIVYRWNFAKGDVPLTHPPEHYPFSFGFDPT